MSLQPCKHATVFGGEVHQVGLVGGHGLEQRGYLACILLEGVRFKESTNIGDLLSRAKARTA